MLPDAITSAPTLPTPVIDLAAMHLYLRRDPEARPEYNPTPVLDESAGESAPTMDETAPSP